MNTTRILGVFFITKARKAKVTEVVFDKVGDQFTSYYDTVRGYVREQLTRLDLAQFIGNEPMDVLDVGGGDGRDAVWLASQGHRVRLVDPSGDMLKKAATRVSNMELDELVMIEHGDPEEILAEDKNTYDLVLSHGVLMYLDNPQSHLNLLGATVKPGGIVSILTKGRAGSLFRLLHKQDVSAADELVKTDRLVNNLGQDVLVVSENSLTPMLQIARLSLCQTFGVRSASEFDDRPITELTNEELALIIKIEAKLGSDENTKGIGQMLHFICKKEEVSHE